MGCNFCSTSAMFGGKGKFVDFYHTGDELFDVMEAIANEPELCVRLSYEAGDVQFINNHHIFHARDSYEDWPEPERRRHLLRLWICPPDAPPLPPDFADRYGGIEIGNRGGIVVPGAQQVAPLTPA